MIFLSKIPLWGQVSLHKMMLGLSSDGNSLNGCILGWMLWLTTMTLNVDCWGCLHTLFVCSQAEVVIFGDLRLDRWSKWLRVLKVTEYAVRVVCCNGCSQWACYCSLKKGSGEVTDSALGAEPTNIQIDVSIHLMRHVDSSFMKPTIAMTNVLFNNNVNGETISFLVLIRTLEWTSEPGDFSAFRYLKPSKLPPLSL